jgi:predicted DNA-binding protein (MmcQ/YjbR family)
MQTMTLKPLTRLRRICLALPQATEQETWGEATFRVRGKIFALTGEDDDGLAFWCKAPPGSQFVLVNADPARFFVPPYVGHKGWIGVRLTGRPDWDEIARIVARSYSLVAPKRLAAAAEARAAGRRAN